DEYVNGSNHGFSTVNKLIRDRNGVLLSKTEYNFSNLTFGTAPYTSMRKRTGLYFHTIAGALAKYRMGQILSVKQYDINSSDNTTPYLVAEQLYEYDDIDETPDNGNPGDYKEGLTSLSHFKGPYDAVNNCGAAEYYDGTVHEYYN